MHGSYPHILPFKRRWSHSPKTLVALGQCEAIIRAISNMPLPPADHEKLLQVSLNKGALSTTAIEGNTLTEEEIQNIGENKSFPPSKDYQRQEVLNVLEAMNQVLDDIVNHQADRLIDADLLRYFHQMIGRDLGEHFDAVPGRFRQDARVVGGYRCPDHRDVPELIDRLSEWLRQEFKYASGQQSLYEAIVQAIVTHVYIEWIHPFGDGNGRTGRLTEVFILLRAGAPDIASHILSNFYNTTRPEYYRKLDRAKVGDGLSDFIGYAVQGLRDGLNETLQQIQKFQFEISWRSFVYDQFSLQKYRKNTFKRRRDLVLDMPPGEPRTPEELMLLTPRIAKAYGSLTLQTMKRDLGALQEMDLIIKEGRGYTPNCGLLRNTMPRRR